MRRSHFSAYAPICPLCRRDGRGVHPIRIAHVLAEADNDIQAGLLHCTNPICLSEYPVIDGIPILSPDVRGLISAHGIALALRDDLPAEIESLFGDAIGPDSWLDGIRQLLSTYGWDAYADLDPAEVALPDGPVPGAVRRCLAELLSRAGPPADPAAPVLDLGCAAGRATFELAAARPAALVLGLDNNLGLLRLARRAATGGGIVYPRRRVGIVYDQRRFPAHFPGAGRVDFWAADATALPFRDTTIGTAVALNLLDCLPDPAGFLASLANALLPEGQFLLASPYDWSTRATPLQAWLGGHSQRADHEGRAEPALRRLLQPAFGWQIDAEVEAWPWHTRLHERAAVSYRAHLVVARRRLADGRSRLDPASPSP